MAPVAFRAKTEAQDRSRAIDERIVGRTDAVKTALQPAAPAHGERAALSAIAEGTPKGVTLADPGSVRRLTTTAQLDAKINKVAAVASSVLEALGGLGISARRDHFQPSALRFDRAVIRANELYAEVRRCSPIR